MKAEISAPFKLPWYLRVLRTEALLRTNPAVCLMVRLVVRHVVRPAYEPHTTLSRGIREHILPRLLHPNFTRQHGFYQYSATDTCQTVTGTG